MKRIINYKTFVNESSGASTLTTEQIDFLNRYVRGKWKLNNDGVVDVDGDFNCFNKGLSDFKEIKFGKVTGYFDCSKNNLTSLEGSPKKVGVDFYCSHNKLTSLEGAPIEVYRSFDCKGNKLTSLEFGPKKVEGNFICSINKLTSLEFGPKGVPGTFNCSFNKLTSLEFGPKEVGSSFNCSFNNLTSLEFSPEKVDVDFYCSNNKLTSLEGVPKEIGGYFWCSYNVGLSTDIINLIFRKMIKYRSDYKTVLKSLWKEISIEDKILLYSSDLDWIEEDEAAKLAKLKKYSNIKKMI